MPSGTLHDFKTKLAWPELAGRMPALPGRLTTGKNSRLWIYQRFTFWPVQSFGSWRLPNRSALYPAFGRHPCQ